MPKSGQPNQRSLPCTEVSGLPWPSIGVTPDLASRIHAGEVHVWSAPIAVAPSLIKRFCLLLDESEGERALRFRFSQDRERFVAARATLRRLLGAYCGCEPEHVKLSYSDRGKPSLANPCTRPIHFNVSHSGDFALFAIASCPVGVDIEQVRALDELDVLATQFFSPREFEALKKVPRTARLAAFYNCWTRKEAFLKGRGDGITEHLKTFDVSVHPEEPARLLRCDIGDDLERWTLHHLEPAPGYIGALAIRSAPLAVRRWSIQ